MKKECKHEFEHVDTLSTLSCEGEYDITLELDVCIFCGVERTREDTAPCSHQKVTVMEEAQIKNEALEKQQANECRGKSDRVSKTRMRR